MGYATSVLGYRVSDVAKRGVTRIGAVETLARLLRGEPIVFVDARREEVWRHATDRLPGAVRLAPDRADETLPIIPVGHTAITYCTCHGEVSSLAAAGLLASRGYEDVRAPEGACGRMASRRGPERASLTAANALATRT